MYVCIHLTATNISTPNLCSEFCCGTATMLEELSFTCGCICGCIPTSIHTTNEIIISKSITEDILSSLLLPTLKWYKRTSLSNMQAGLLSPRNPAMSTIGYFVVLSLLTTTAGW